MMELTVYVVKFPGGYYADEQPNGFNWQFDDAWVMTPDWRKSRLYYMRQLAESRGCLGVGLERPGLESYEIEIRKITIDPQLGAPMWSG